MKIKIKLLTLTMLCFSTISNSQFLKKLSKVAEKAAQKTVEKRVDEETQKKTDKTLDSIFDNKKSKKIKNKKKKSSKDIEPIAGSDTHIPKVDKEYNIQRANDFKSGNLIFFEDSFEKDALGDFPAKWDTNGSGEIVDINNENWFRLSGNSKYIPMVAEALPENYTVEFELLTQGLDDKTSSHAWLKILLEDNKGYQKSKDWSMVELSPCQYIKSQGTVEKVVNGERQFRNVIGKDYREVINGRSYISIAVNKTRMRVWINDNKLVDVPRLVTEEANNFKLITSGLRDQVGLDEIYITNFKMAKSGEDNRSKLLTKGHLSTNAILFESGSANLKDQSYGIIREIAKILEENPKVNIKIIGHTDADGGETENLDLSKERAKAVKNTMTLQYGIKSNRISTDGMGENQPIASNIDEKGKAKNRRVEFIKL